MSKALRLSEDDLRNIKARAAGVPTLKAMRDNPVERVSRTQKYGNEKVQAGAMRFDSKAEYRRWEYLATLEKAGEIRDLRMQVPFELIPAQVAPSGAKHRPTSYLADFVYLDRDGAQVVEDVKGAVTPEFRLKRKLLLFRHGIEIQEIRS